jgi:hypothetical protein
MGVFLCGGKPQVEEVEEQRERFIVFGEVKKENSPEGSRELK